MHGIRLSICGTIVGKARKSLDPPDRPKNIPLSEVASVKQTSKE